MRVLDKRLLRMIGHSKGQFISIVAIVVVALAIYILFNITSINIRSAVSTYYEQTQISDLHIELMKLPEAQVAEVQKLKGVDSAMGRLSFDVPMKVADPEEQVTLRLMSRPSVETVNKLYPISGDVGFIKSGSSLLLQQFAVARSLKEGDTITPVINGVDYHLTVQGVVASSEFIYLMENEQALMPNVDQFGIAYIPEDFAQSIYGYNGFYNELLLTLDGTVSLEEMKERLDVVLKPYGVKRVTELENQLSYTVLMQKMDGVEQMASVLPILFLFVGGIIIIIMLSRIVSNDRMVIGVLKALGYSNLQVMVHYIQYALTIGLVGSMLGILIGLGFSGPLSEVFVFFFNIPYVHIAVYPSYILKAVALTSVFCVLSGLLGARGILQIMPADAMRPETPKSGKRILLERIPFLWKRIPFTWKMVIRNVMRLKLRFGLLAFGLAMAYGINTVPLYMGTSVPLMFQKQYGEFQKMDYVIEFTQPLNQSAVLAVSQLIDAKAIEPKLEYPFALKNHWYEETAVLIGVPSNSQLLRFKDEKQRDLLFEPNRIYITKALAQALHVEEGDQLTVETLLPGKSDITLTIGPIVEQYLGSNAYMELESMQRNLMDYGLITGVNVASEADIKESLKDVKQIALIRSSQDIKDSFLEYMDTLIVATNAYMLFGGLLGFALIYNATIIGISERRMEFSSLRVMGFDKNEIFKIVTRENSLLAVASIFIGIPLGISMINGMSVAFSSSMITFPRIYSPSIFLTAIGATAVYVMIAQLATRRKIFKLDFIEALKSRIS